MTIDTIQTYVINLKKRIDRRDHILREFHGRNEFTVHLVPACEHSIGAVGLWNTIRHILQDLCDNADEFIIICEDDHQFTGDYSKEVLLDAISEARRKNADILSGGLSWFNNALQVSADLFWVDDFSGFQFTVLFNKFFRTILEAPFKDGDVADFKMASLTVKKFFIYPFLSFQKEFGYSDVTLKNNTEGRVEDLFNKSSSSAQILKEVREYYQARSEGTDNTNGSDETCDPDTYENISIPTYVINLPERTDRLHHIQSQFQGKPEFDVKIIEACRHKIGAFGLWNSIRGIVQDAITNDDDVIIVCEDDHQFTENYTRDFLFRNILEAYEQGTSILSGGIGGFGITVPITKNRLWVNSFYSTQFVVLYRSIFQKIMDEPVDERVTADGIFSDITSNKMVIYPFISTQKDFGYSDVTTTNNQNNGHISNLFYDTSERLKRIYEIKQLFT